MQQTSTSTTATADDRAADEASQISHLPAALLARILQSVPQQERLSSCATVCESWAKAAAAATVDVDVRPLSRCFTPSRQDRERTAAFQPWLEQHAGQLVSLRVEDVDWHEPTKPEFHLPIRQLQQLSRLDLQGLQVLSHPAADDSSSNDGAAPPLAKLQELRLHFCTLSCSDSLLQLAQLSGVTHFEYAHPFDFDSLEAVKHLLPGMQNLECLSLTGQFLEAASIMQGLPAHSLTALTFYSRISSEGYVSHLGQLPDSASRLVNLRELKLSGQLNPLAFAGMTLLTKLELGQCEPAGGEDGDTSGTLAAVRGMRQLQHLEVDNYRDALLQAADPRTCAALTASSQLTCLRVRISTPLSPRHSEAQPLPATALQHMFPAGKQLPRLQHLQISSSKTDRAFAGCITAAELSGLVDACPGLTFLDVTHVLAPDADVSVLLKLPQQCQHLKVGEQAFGDKAAAVVAQLTQLTQLDWTRSLPLADAGVAQLTALHKLDTLILRYANHGHYYTAPRITKSGGQSVSQQLCELLLKAPSSGP